VAGVNDSISLDIAWISVNHATTWCAIDGRSVNRGTSSINFDVISIDFDATRGDLATRRVDFDSGRANFDSSSVDLASICCNCDGHHGCRDSRRNGGTLSPCSGRSIVAPRG